MTGIAAALSNATVLLGLAVIVLVILVLFVAWASRWQLRRQQEFVRRQQADILAQQTDQFTRAQATREAILSALERQTDLLQEIRDRLAGR
ncbi:MAG: hypothetical protein H6843_15195 [Rhodospirillaceae bacterium]|nr:hypothetical protein [Rhodospirillaceae bacterium]